MKTILFMLFFTCSASFGAKCVVDDPDIGYIKVEGIDQNHALERTIVKCFNDKENWYKSNNTKISFDVLKKFIDDCANPICSD